MRVKKMDNKTTQKVINNMADKIEALETNIKELEQKANRTGQFHLDAINEKFNKCFNKFDKIDARLEALEKINLLDADRNIKYMEHFENLGDSVYKLNERCDILTKCDTKIIDCLDNIESKIIEHYDDLEAKNYQIKSDLDKLINDEKTITVGELREFKNWEEFNEVMLQVSITKIRAKAALFCSLQANTRSFASPIFLSF